MKRILPLIILVLAMAVFGCNAQKKPVPQEPREKIIPQESTIGFEQVDVEQAPASVKRILSNISNREMIAWANAADNNYIIINPEPGETIKVDKVIQRVPSQNFLWLDVMLIDVDDKGNKKTTATPLIIKLDKTDKSVNGVGFEINDGDEEQAKSTAETPPVAPKPVAPPPAAPTNPVPENKPVTPREITPKAEQPQEKEQQEREQKQEKVQENKKEE